MYAGVLPQAAGASVTLSGRAEASTRQGATTLLCAFFAAAVGKSQDQCSFSWEALQVQGYPHRHVISRGIVPQCLED